MIILVDIDKHSIEEYTQKILPDKVFGDNEWKLLEFVELNHLEMIFKNGELLRQYLMYLTNPELKFPDESVFCAKYIYLDNVQDTYVKWEPLFVQDGSMWKLITYF